MATMAIGNANLDLNWTDSGHAGQIGVSTKPHLIINDWPKFQTQMYCTGVVG